MVRSNRRSCFEAEWIKQLGIRSLYEFDHKPSVLYVAIDPSGGGNQSDFGLTTIAFENCRNIVRKMFHFYISQMHVHTHHSIHEKLRSAHE